MHAGSIPAISTCENCPTCGQAIFAFGDGARQPPVLRRGLKGASMLSEAKRLSQGREPYKTKEFAVGGRLRL